MAVPTWKTEFKQLAPNVYAFIQGGGPGVTNFGVSDAGLIVGDDGCMVVDTTRGPIPAKMLLANVKKTTSKPVRHVVNTHGHPDHIGGNQFFMPTEIIAHEKGREIAIAAGIPAPIFKAEPGNAVGDEPHILTLPNTTLPANSVMKLYYSPAITIELHAIEPAHTLGDVLVWLPQQKILFGGDCCFFYVGPIAGGSNYGCMRTLEWILTLDVDWIVPGHGPLGTKKDVQKNLEYFTTLRDGLMARYAAGITPGAAAATMDMGEFADWPDGQDRLLGNTLRFYREFQGKPYDPIPQAETAAARQEYQSLLKK